MQHTIMEKPKQFVIGKYINDISLNGLEYLLDKDGNEMVFDSYDDCLTFVKVYITKDQPEDYVFDVADTCLELTQ